MAEVLSFKENLFFIYNGSNDGFSEAIDRLDGKERKVVEGIFAEGGQPEVKSEMLSRIVTKMQKSSSQSLIKRIFLAISRWWHGAKKTDELVRQIIQCGTSPKTTTRVKKEGCISIPKSPPVSIPGIRISQPRSKNGSPPISTEEEIERGFEQMRNELQELQKKEARLLQLLMEPVDAVNDACIERQNKMGRDLIRTRKQLQILRNQYQIVERSYSRLCDCEAASQEQIQEQIKARETLHYSTQFRQLTEGAYPEDTYQV